MWTTVNWLILAASAVLMIYIGLRSSRVCKDSDEAGFLVAGGNLGMFVVTCTIVATGYSGWCFMGAPGVAYQFGAIELLGNFMFAPAIAFAVMFFSSSMRKRAHKVQSLTVPEFIAKYHGEGGQGRFIQGLSAAITVILLLVFLTGQIRAVGLLTAQWLDIDVQLAATLIIALMIFYTAFGGLQAVAWTDTVMVVGMMIATVYITGKILGDVSLSDMVTQLNAIDPGLLNPADSTPYGSTKSSVFLILPYAFMFAAVLPYMCIRFLAMKDSVKVHSVGLWTAVFAAVLSLIPIVGMYMRIKMPGLENPDTAMPTYLANFIHPAIAGVITLCILFAMKSTANSLLHTIASAVSHDLRKSLLPDRQFTAAQKLRLNRLAVLFLGVLGLIMTFYAPKAFLNFFGYLGTGTLQATLIGPVLIGTFWRGNSYGCIASMLSGCVVASYLLLATDAGWVMGPITGDIVGCVVYVAVSKATFAVQPRVRLAHEIDENGTLPDAVENKATA